MGVAVFDLDGTLIRGDSFLAFLSACLQKYPRRIARCPHLPMAAGMYYMKLRDNAWLKSAFVAAVVGGLSREQLEEVTAAFIERVVEREIKAEARRTLEQLSARGFQLVVASASLDVYVEPLAAKLGFDHVVCTQLAWRDDVCAGALLNGNCYGIAKQAAIVNRFGRVDLAYSDHHSDLPLLLQAERGIAVDPSRKLAALAARHQLEVVRWRT